MNAPVKLQKNSNSNLNIQLPIKNYQEFYHFYLTEHRNILSRRLHVAGSSV
ncbi:Mpo1-like protein, partial [Acinetobacter ursingii]